MSDYSKYYTVWVGREPGVYDNWDDAEEQVRNFPGARYKSFKTKEAAVAAFRGDDARELGAIIRRLRQPAVRITDPAASSASSASSAKPAFKPAASASGRPAAAAAQRPATADMRVTGVKAASSAVLAQIAVLLAAHPEIDPYAWCVDASCMGNPGVMEYRGVELATGREIFRVGFPKGTNNIGEYLAIVHALALMEKTGKWHNIYTDSKNALLWLRTRNPKTKLAVEPATARLHAVLSRATAWLKAHPGVPRLLFKSPATRPEQPAVRPAQPTEADLFSSQPAERSGVAAERSERPAAVPLLIKWDTEHWGEIPADFDRK